MLEIERKFLVKDFMPSAKGEKIVQGYLGDTDAATVRVRIRGEQGYLTIKGKREGISCNEFEYEIPLRDAESLLEMAALNKDRYIIEKTRYLESYEGQLFEVDVFEGENAGLIVAELELASEDATYTLPHWILREVSDDVRYYNSKLSKIPYSKW